MTLINYYEYALTIKIFLNSLCKINKKKSERATP